LTRRLEYRGPDPRGGVPPLAGGDPVSGEQEADDHREVVLDPRREEDRLVAESAEREEDDDGDEMGGGDLGLHERPEQRQDERGVEADVEPRPGRAAEHRKVRKQWELRRAGTQEVQRRGEWRPYPQPEGSAHASEAHHLDEAGPQEGLLERGPLEDPRGEVPQRADAGREAAEEHPAEHEEGQLDRVEQVDGGRIPDAL